jgi:hypothetical protein
MINVAELVSNFIKKYDIMPNTLLINSGYAISFFNLFPLQAPQKYFNLEKFNNTRMCGNLEIIECDSIDTIEVCLR